MTADLSSSIGHPRSGRVARFSRPGPLWAVPALVIFGLFALAPIVVAAVLSLTDWNGLGAPRFIGVDNWVKLLQDPRLGKSLMITLALLVANLLVQLPLSVVLGVWSAGFQRWRAIATALFFIPLVLSIAATSVVWRQIFDPNYGFPSVLASIFGGDGDFIGTPWGALAAIVIVSAWSFVPFHALLHQGAARGIPQVLYDAAEVDGAGRVAQFFHVTLPQLRNSMITSTIFIVVGSLTSFDLIFILTRGGPGTATATLPLMMYATAFQANEFGYGSAAALMLVALAAVVSVILVRVTRYDRMESIQEGV